MALKINVDTSKYNQIFPLILEGIEYQVHIYWNDALLKRGFSKTGWYLSLYETTQFTTESGKKPFDSSKGADNPDSLLIGGRKLLPNQDVLSVVYNPVAPTGKLLLVDTDYTLGRGPDTDYYVGLDNFGTGKRFQLFYYTNEEYTTLLAEFS